MLWTIFLLLNGLLLLVLLYSTRTRQTNEPPLDKGFLPWLGHALEFGRNAAEFLARMKDKHGDIFTVRVAGRYITVLLDPYSFDAVLQDTVGFDFTRRKSLLIKRIFNLQMPSNNPCAQREWMKRSFKDVSLSKLSNSMRSHLQMLLPRDTRWRQDGLFSLSYSLLFRASYLTLFERRDNTDKVYKEFRKFDGLLSKLVYGTLKRGESRTATLSQECLWELLYPEGLDEGSKLNSWQQNYHQFLQEEGVDAEMQKRAFLYQLWTTQCNVGPAAFWLLGFLLTHPEAMEAVCTEIRGVTPQDRSRQHFLLNISETHNTPVFDSALGETLRLTAAVMINRDVVQDRILHMANGQEYHLRQGDTICLFPYLSPQMDRQIHEEPQSFRYDRFLNDDMTEKKIFYKDGKRLKYYTMPWGAGTNMCVGKVFAVAAIKQFVFMVLTHLDLEMCDPKAHLPSINHSRYGFGVIQPDGDLQVRYRLRGHLSEV
ncbi:prostacyclin synthase [Thalassophryne amazonica]|uniref:prostacyclin synthase n=1 Tax=Thalassophryne amazonica TaxID=390379 RepID=UPI00147163A0|nr:prostacyclin synthase [Thalassophryne amazonica]